MSKRDQFIQTVELPPNIKYLMRSGLWKATENCTLNEQLKNIHHWGDKVRLLSNLEKDDCGLIFTSGEGLRDLYGTYLTGALDDESNLDWIDANKAIMIACNYDEEAICLDYRFSKQRPRIVASYYSEPGTSGRWRQIAESEEELIVKLGIEL